MTALEQQLTTALRRLSVQYEQVATLRQQVERLDGQVTRLVQDYRRSAETWHWFRSGRRGRHRPGGTGRRLQEARLAPEY